MAISEMSEPPREEVDRMPGPVLLEFGASWCSHCLALKPHLDKMLSEFPQVHFLWVEDGKGKPLGRSFRVKLWPTLVLMRDGEVIQQLVRPEPEEVRAGLQALANKRPAEPLP
jgi:thioredoxin 1